MSESSYTPSLERLAQYFRSLPGVGKKSAYRMAFFILDMSEDKAISFANAIIEAKKTVKMCSVCMNISEEEICPVCADSKRDERTICVVENPRDVGAIFRLNEYKGLFHVLHGVISPLDGKTPDMLKIKELIARITALCSKYPENEIEVILATNASVEGEATAMYISKLLKPFGIKITRLAYGLSVGSDLEYTDEITLFKAIEGRTILSL